MSGSPESQMSESAQSAKAQGSTKRKLLTQERVRELFQYRDNGDLIRKVSTNSRAIKGGVSGCLGSNGYLSTRISGVSYLNHRIVFLYHHGVLPHLIDHIDGNKLNNKIENLRAVSRSGNGQNQKKYQKHNKSKLLGVTFVKSHNLYRAQIKKDGIQEYLGYFKDKTAAHKAYLKRKKEIHPYSTI